MLQGRWCVVCRLVAFALGLAALLLGPASAQQPAAGPRFEGILSVIWGDPRPGRSGGETRFSLTLPDGTRYPLQIDAAQQNSAIGYFGKRVVVQGRMTRSAAGVSRIAVDQIEALEPRGAIEQPAVAKRRVLYILLKFKGDAQEPHPPSFFADLTNPKRPPDGSNVVATLNGFYNKTSWGKLKWIADVVGQGGLNPTHWLTLPRSKNGANGYAPCGFQDVCADLDGIQQDGIALAINAGVDVSVYDNINFVLNNDLDCCAWGGGFVYNGKAYGATWEPPWGQEAGTYVHEFGHSIGLPHSGWVYYAYDTPWDEMGSGSPAQSAQCATYFSANDNQNEAVNCTEPGAGYITAHKDFLGWIPAANRVVIDQATTRTVRLEANAWPLDTGIKMIKVCFAGSPCTGAHARYLTVEARIRGRQFEDGLPGEGVIIHDFRADRGPIGAGNDCFFNTQSGWAVPIDATKGDYNGEPACNSGGRPYPNYALFNAQFLPGDIYRNRSRHITIKVLKRKGSSFTVKVIRSE
jgi:hypothetical protein